MGEYDWLFYKFPKTENASGGMLATSTAYFRGDSCVPGSQLYLPYRAFTKPGIVLDAPHFHRDEEYLAFVGHDLRNAFDSFDAEIELWLGETPETMRKIVLDKPTMIRVPPFYWHGPVEIKRLGKPLFFQPVLFNGRYYAIRRRENGKGEVYYETVGDNLTPRLPEASGACLASSVAQTPPENTDTPKYDHLIYTFEKQYTYWGDFMPPYQAYFRGHDCMPDSSFYSSYRCYMKEAFIDRTPNFHTEEEYLCFIGYDMADPLGSFDADIEFWIGKDINNLEKHVITEPTIVRIPPFYWHCPLEFKRLGKPVYLQVLCTRGRFGAFFQKTDEDGKVSIEYRSPDSKKACVLDKTKRCTVCGKCWKMKADKESAEKASEK